MIFLRFCTIALMLVFSTPALAQMAPKSTPNLSIEELGKLWRGEPRLWLDATPKVEGPIPMPQARPHDHSSAPAKEPKFSEWGYRHKELHAKGVIAEMLERLKGANCCDGIMSGECRLSEVNLSERLVLVDDDWCPMDTKTRVTPLETLGAISDGDHAVAVVCASNTYGKRCQTTSYCVGVKAGI